jgi:hypothetical protein
MFGLNFLSPEKGIELIRSRIEKDLNKKITKFDLHFDVIKDEMFFFVDSEKIPFLSDTLIPLIKGVVKQKSKKGVILHYILLRYSEIEIFLNIYYYENDEKKFTKHIIK